MNMVGVVPVVGSRALIGRTRPSFYKRPTWCGGTGRRAASYLRRSTRGARKVLHIRQNEPRPVREAAPQERGGRGSGFHRRTRIAEQAEWRAALLSGVHPVPAEDSQ